MQDRAQVSMTPRERFMRMAQDEMLAFEKREGALRKKDREERAAQLKLPLDVDDLH
ncbi:hypothetical protein AB7783_07320 [Tardiphaga sp. 172_B4_N1_3]|uniref:hypothetical protein n=1 Tax=Tardiphaga sp. 172_B4_N1_3 TaxID=3240787 RepID=UPI003F8C03C5